MKRAPTKYAPSSLEDGDAYERCYQELAKPDLKKAAPLLKEVQETVPAVIYDILKREFDSVKKLIKIRTKGTQDEFKMAIRELFIVPVKYAWQQKYKEQFAEALPEDEEVIAPTSDDTHSPTVSHVPDTIVQ